MKFQYDLAVSLFFCERKEIAKTHRLGGKYEHSTKDIEIANTYLKNDHESLAKCKQNNSVIVWQTYQKG